MASAVLPEAIARKRRATYPELVRICLLDAPGWNSFIQEKLPKCSLRRKYPARCAHARLFAAEGVCRIFG